jgi:hypothetical protein
MCPFTSFKRRYSFTDHPASVGETYLEHLHSAWGFSGSMITAGMACFLHGLLPFLFVRTASQTIASLHDRMVLNRERGRKPSLRD